MLAHSLYIPAHATDLDQSGGKLHRPGLDAVLERIHTGQTGGLAVAHLDRLSRAGVADALRLVESVQEAGVKIAVVDLGIDPTTPVGEVWTRSTVNHLIHNPAYLGRATCGKHVQIEAHPALVSTELWEAANSVKAQGSESR